MNQSNRRLLIKAASLLVDQAATLAALEKSKKANDTVNLQAGLTFTANFKRIQPHFFEMETLVRARANDNEIFGVLREIVEKVKPALTPIRAVYSPDVSLPDHL